MKDAPPEVQAAWHQANQRMLAGALAGAAGGYRPAGPKPGGKHLREPNADDAEVEIAVAAELAKIGVLHDDAGERGALPRSKALEARNDARRAINAISARALAEKREYSRQENLALDGLSEIVKSCDDHIALQNEARSAATAPAGGEWRNAATGEPVRVVGREHAGTIRAALGSQGQPDCTLGDFFRGVAGMKTTPTIRAALSSGTDSAGGFAVPSLLFPDFVEALIPASSVLQAGARVIPLDDSAKSFRFARVATVPAAAWRAEAGTVAESDPTFSALDLTPQSLSFYFKVSRELLADSPNIDAMLTRAVAQAFAKELDRAALRGSGTLPEIRGLLNTSGIGAVTNGANGTALATIKWGNLNSAYQTILEANAPVPATAIMAPRTLVGFAGLADTTGQPLRRPALLEPMQFIATSALPVNLTVGTSPDCTEMFVGDFREFVIGLREDVSVLVAKELHAGTGQVGFFCNLRADVGVLHAASFAKVTGIRP